LQCEKRGRTTPGGKSVSTASPSTIAAADLDDNLSDEQEEFETPVKGRRPKRKAAMKSRGVSEDHSDSEDDYEASESDSEDEEDDESDSDEEFEVRRVHGKQASLKGKGKAKVAAREHKR
jgi:hypothetical protein